MQQYVKVLKNVKRSPHKPAHLVEECPLSEEPSGSESGAREDEEAALYQRLMQTDDAEEQVEILAFMNEKGFGAPGRGQGGPRKIPSQGPSPERPVSLSNVTGE